MSLTSMVPKMALLPTLLVKRRGNTRIITTSISTTTSKSILTSTPIVGLYDSIRHFSSGTTIRNKDDEGVNHNHHNSKGKLLVLGGTGFLGKEVCKEAVKEGYSVTSISRKGRGTNAETDTKTETALIEYRKGDVVAEGKEIVTNILHEGGYIGVIHCIGLLFDDTSGLGHYNQYVSGAQSTPGENKYSYDQISRVSSFHAIDACIDYMQHTTATTNTNDTPTPPPPLPFLYTSAAEAGWPQTSGGRFVEKHVAPTFLKRYLVAKRQVEERLLSTDENTSNNNTNLIRPIVFRPSLIYSTEMKPEHLAKLPTVAALTMANAMGLDFIDKPIQVQTVASAMIQAIIGTNNNTTPSPAVSGILRGDEISKLVK